MSPLSLSQITSGLEMVADTFSSPEFGHLQRDAKSRTDPVFSRPQSEHRG